jgi:protein kinase C substrate 80K-H
VNKQHRGKWVAASRVDDGVCDCCDGSDEPPGCPDGCGAAAAAARAAAAQRIQTLEGGARVKQEYVARAAADAAARGGKLAAAEAEVAAARAKLEALEAGTAKLVAEVWRAAAAAVSSSLTYPPFFPEATPAMSRRLCRVSLVSGTRPESCGW